MARLRGLFDLRSRLHRPRQTVRLRLTLLYGVIVLVSGASLLALTYLLGTPKNGTVDVWIKSQTLGPVGSIIGPGNIPAMTASSGRIAGSGSSLIMLSGGHGTAGALTISEAQFAAQLGSSNAVHQLFFWSGIALAIVAVLGVALGWIMSGRMLRPLRTMTLMTQHISEDNLHERLAIIGPRGDEVKELGDTIDGLLGRLESAFDAQGRFVQNASHELRTPIAMMRTSLDVATGKPGGVHEEVSLLASKLGEGLDQAERLVESFLMLARVQQGDMADVSVFALSDAVIDAIGVRREDIERLRFELREDLNDAPVRASWTLLSQMTANLVDNAVRHNETRGWLSIATSANGDIARLVVENGGPVLDQSRVDELGQPFQRIGVDRTASRDGVGLGLSIVSAIATALGGTMSLRARDEGGLRVTVELPLAKDPALSGARR